MKFYAARDGETYGPYSGTELRSFVEQGIFPATVLICPEGSEHWTPLNSGDTPPALTPNQRPPTEETLFQEGNITVTRSRFTVGERTFAVPSIISVRPVEISHRGPAIFMALVGAYFVHWGLRDDRIGFVIAGIFLACVGLLAACSNKWEHAVVLTTAGGEVRAVTNKDKAYLAAIATALNKTIGTRSP